MEIFLLYNSDDGSGMICEIVGTEIHIHYHYAPNSFAKQWTAIADIPLGGGRVLFYDNKSGAAVVGWLTPDGFLSEKPYPAGSFGTWTNIAPIFREGYGRLLFYNARSGRAAVGFDPTIATYEEGTLSPGWTAITPSLSSERILFYNKTTGAGALGFDPSWFALGPGSFGKNWTHVASAPTVDGEDVLLFYDADYKAGALGRLSSFGFRTVATYDPGTFGTWTHLIGYSKGFFFYDRQSGSAALAAIDNERIVTTKTWPAGSMKAGWDTIIRSSNAMQFAKLEGYAWPWSAKPGETIDFKVTTDAEAYQATFISFKNADPSKVTARTIEQSEELVELPFGDPVKHVGGMQTSERSPATGAANWNVSFTFTVPRSFESGFYAVKLADSEGDSSYIPFIVQPRDNQRADFAVIVNLSTWNAYNAWGGYSRYSLPHAGPGVFSYHRPLSDVLNPGLSDGAYHYASKHQGRGELWVINWLKEAGFTIDLHTDLDLHEGVINLDSYKALIFSTHPEYLSIKMRNAVETYLSRGGSLLYLGANGFYDAVDIADDLSTLTVYGTYGAGRTHMFRQPPLNRPESALLGVAFPWNSSGGDIGNNPYSRVAYRCVQTNHPFFNGTGLHDGDLFGAEGWCILEGSPSLAGGGASGWECDSRDAHSPSNVVLLAKGENEGPAAEMVTYDHAGGGFVFSAGSMTIQGAIPVDPVIQQIVRNVLNAARGR